MTSVMINAPLDVAQRRDDVGSPVLRMATLQIALGRASMVPSAA